MMKIVICMLSTCCVFTLCDQNISQIVQSWGFTAEEYVVVTEDGYHIGVERVYNEINKENPIVVGHGIMMNAEGFTTNGKKSIAYVLANEGYDVWLITFRGGKYSLGHENLTPYQYQYWNFSFHEMMVYDFKSASDLVLETTQRKSIYIGYSMGNQVGIGYGSLFPDDMSKKFVGMAAFSPATFYINQRSFARFMIPFMPLLMTLDRIVFDGRLLYIIPMVAPMCAIGATPMYFCHGLAGLMFGADYEQINPETYPVFFTNVPDQICLKTLNHMFQMAQSGNFQQYDYGVVKNLEYYKEKSPPIYNITNMPIPLSLWVGENDWISTLESARKINTLLMPQFRCKINIINWEKWSHLDFLSAKDIDKLLFKSLLPELDKLAQGTCTK